MEILGIGPMELILILIIALMVFGPDKLPEMGAKLGKSMRQMREATREFSREIEETRQAIEAPINEVTGPVKQIAAAGKAISNPGAALKSAVMGEITQADQAAQQPSPNAATSVPPTGAPAATAEVTTLATSPAQPGAEPPAAGAPAGTQPLESAAVAAADVTTLGDGGPQAVQAVAPISEQGETSQPGAEGEAMPGSLSGLPQPIHDVTPITERGETTQPAEWDGRDGRETVPAALSVVAAANDGAQPATDGASTGQPVLASPKSDFALVLEALERNGISAGAVTALAAEIGTTAGQPAAAIADDGAGSNGSQITAPPAVAPTMAEESQPVLGQDSVGHDENALSLARQRKPRRTRRKQASAPLAGTTPDEVWPNQAAPEEDTAEEAWRDQALPDEVSPISVQDGAGSGAVVVSTATDEPQPALAEGAAEANGKLAPAQEAGLVPPEEAGPQRSASPEQGTAEAPVRPVTEE